MVVRGLIGAGVLASLFVLAPAAPASDIDLTKPVMDARNAVHLPAIAENPAVLAAAGAVLSGVDPKVPFTTAGGVGDLVTASVPSGGALATADLKVIVFDPRLTAIAVLGRGNKVAVAAALDPTRPFSAPILAGTLVDPAVAGAIAILYPPGGGTIPQITVQRKRGPQMVTIGIAATAVPGVEGATLIEIKGRDQVSGPQIGYGLSYTLKIGTKYSFTLQTRPVPPVLTARPFVAGPGFKGADRQTFLNTVNRLPPAARKVIDTIRGAITASILRNSAPICGEQTSCAGFDPGNGYFMIINRGQLHSSFGRFAITHELGHLADFLGLDTFSHEAFKGLFDRSAKWKSCFPLRGQCTPFVELFADQFAFYSTNARGVQTGYNDDRLATSSSFSTLMQTQWAFRPPQELNPLAGYGPLAKSFATALHSGESAL